ncbi:MAG: hypothetical protein JSU04_11695 [Bdellovibrionales bacterium]|nr:hypothetical protein [Bdellovibrionales bacterium]
MKKFAFIALSMVLAACANPNKAKDLDTKVDMTAPVNAGGVIGVKDGDMVYQRKVQMNEELRNLETEVYNLEAKVYGGPRYLDNRGLYGVLKDCRAEMSEKSNGGDGKLLWTEKREYVTAEDDVSKIGVEDKKKIVGVSEEYLKDRLERFKNYRKVLMDRQEEYETKVKVCELELKSKQKTAAKNKTADE